MRKSVFNFPIFIQFSRLCSENASGRFMRSHSCGGLSANDVGKKVTLCGWLSFQRMDKFALLRDAFGTTQLIVPEKRVDIKESLQETPLESAVIIEGVVNKRPDSQIRKDNPTGEIEVVLSTFKAVNPVKKKLPFIIRDHNKPKENVRMKYRYLDIRTAEMQKNLRLRSEMVFKMREALRNRGFVDVETPTLFRRTPGGAQEFLVPTQNAGEFYSLVQSPQQLKQLLMVGGIDKYYQIAKCYRDEGSRPDRQPEFTQLDLEMSWVNQEHIMKLVEEVLSHSWPGGTPNSFPRITYTYAMETYGSDKPHLGFSELKIYDAGKLVNENLNANSNLQNACKVLHIPDGAKLLISPVKSKLSDLFNNMAKEVLFKPIKITDTSDWIGSIDRTGWVKSPTSLLKLIGGQSGDLLFLGVGQHNALLNVLGQVRNEMISLLMDSSPQHDYYWVWITDFPLFVESSDGCLESAHHPFTAPHPDHIINLESDPLKVQGLHYDLVLNGCEVGGGSVRNHCPLIQSKILNMLGIPPASLKHILEALASGAPPHAGIALGLDRLVSFACGTESIRDVIAFPKSHEGRDLMAGAPTSVSADQLKLYNIQLSPSISVQEKAFQV